VVVVVGGVVVAVVVRVLSACISAFPSCLWVCVPSSLVVMLLCLDACPCCLVSKLLVAGRVSLPSSSSSPSFVVAAVSAIPFEVFPCCFLLTHSCDRTHPHPG
jgi:hypothetical protein